jgi:hypothetical protein
MVVYFDELAEPTFDTELDALKLFNTDWLVTNLYSLISEGSRLSVNALPLQTDTAVYVPLGLTSYRDGEVCFRIRNIENLPGDVRIMLRDAVTGANVSMLPSGEYKVNLPAGDYKNRFVLAFLRNTTGTVYPRADASVFSAYSSGGLVKATVWSMDGKEGLITVYNLNGSPVFVQRVFETGRYDLPVPVKAGIYIVKFTSGDLRSTLKLIIGL